MTQVVDYSFARPAAGDIAAAGFVGAIRYLRGRGKAIDRAELDALHAAGLAVGFVEESTANRAGQGYDAGHLDAIAANQAADALGVPADRPLFYAVDFQSTWPIVADYFAGARDAGGRPVGVYGCYDVIEGAAAAGFVWLWQCAAWSGNGSGTGGSIQNRRLSIHALLFQRVGYVLGDTSDANDVLAADWGGWHPSQSYPTPSTPTTSQEDDMASLIVNDPDHPEQWWEIVGLQRRLMSTAFGTAEIDVQSFLGAKVLGPDTDADGRRLWLNMRVPLVSVAPDAKAIADQVIAAIGNRTDISAQAVADELAKRLAS